MLFIFIRQKMNMMKVVLFQRKIEELKRNGKVIMKWLFYIVQMYNLVRLKTNL